MPKPKTCPHGNDPETCDRIEIKIVNRHHQTPSPVGFSRFYIGRPSLLGNPFVVGDDGDRDECVDKYAEWIKKEIHRKGNRVYPAIVNIVEALTVQCYVELECFCAPKRCHGEVIREIVLADDWLYK